MTPVNLSGFSDAYMRRWTWSTLFHVMVCRLFGAKPLPKPMLTNCEMDPYKLTLVKCISEYKFFIDENAFENIVCEMAAILYRGWGGGCVNIY